MTGHREFDEKNHAGAGPQVLMVWSCRLGQGERLVCSQTISVAAGESPSFRGALKHPVDEARLRCRSACCRAAECGASGGLKARIGF